MLPIRRAISSDIDQLTELRLFLFQEVGILPQQSEPLREATRAYLTASLPQETFLAWVAESDRKLVATSGVVIFQRPPSPHNLSGKEAYVLNMYTFPEWRGQGLASALLQEIMNYARNLSIRRLWLHATESGRPVYEKAGFRARAEEMELVW